ISTLGFRGEALSSICAVSDFEICSKTKDSLTGNIIKVKGGAESDISEAALPDGTTVIVKDLFYNVPARAKFLGSFNKEASMCTEVVYKTALSHADISIKYVVDGKLKLSTSGNGNLIDIIYGQFGRDTAVSLIPVSDTAGVLTVSGYIGKTNLVKSNRNQEIFFINGRFIKDRVLENALEEAYRPYIMKGNFPFCVLNIKIEPELVDVNVHPAKREVRFSDNETVFDSFYTIINRALSAVENIPGFTLGKKETEIKPASEEYIPEPFENRADISIPDAEPIHKKSDDFPGTEGVSENEKLLDADGLKFTDSDIPAAANVFNADISENDVNADKREDFILKYQDALKASEDSYVSEQKQWFLKDESIENHRIIGEIFDTYWLVEFNNQLYIIDQHAAHEKVLYERILKKIENNTQFSQFLAPGFLVTLSPTEEVTLERYMDAFRTMGFNIENYGGSDYMISEVPADLMSLNSKALFMSLLEELEEIPTAKNPAVLLERTASAACKAAVKGGNRISFMEADALIKELLKLDNPYNCPHGRPTIITMTRQELERKFKRLV
ncbi:MAG: DNA mismatch repair protein MutL, partial [Parasporobacterium sp.]|nr:DNA mismatch repair protein MutL [Parasporobacterium sp.]